ncbi:hypothetical protein [Corallincola spongiicola]|uniref:Integral membrane protein n=1 Tax=Corallincola spongiicola TaxID=2520508 RepID=A0ABY1WRQ8_9GAMM|nr:hypothetical protein [Corallincola spongiicola]TAA47422.1 hypothetical protein EXY25_09350 [Corallincola spongiicola]
MITRMFQDFRVEIRTERGALFKRFTPQSASDWTVMIEMFEGWRALDFSEQILTMIDEQQAISQQEYTLLASYFKFGEMQQERRVFKVTIHRLIATHHLLRPALLAGCSATLCSLLFGALFLLIYSAAIAPHSDISLSVFLLALITLPLATIAGACFGLLQRRWKETKVMGFVMATSVPPMLLFWLQFRSVEALPELAFATATLAGVAAYLLFLKLFKLSLREQYLRLFPK